MTGSHKAPERRSSYRLALPEGSVALALPGLPTLEVADLSAEGMKLVLPDRGALARVPLASVLHLGRDSSLGVELSPVRRPPLGPGGSTVGVQFAALSQSGRRELSRFLSDGFTRASRRLARLNGGAGPLLRVRRRTRIVELLRLHGQQRGQTLTVYEGDEPLAGCALLRTLTPDLGWLEVSCDPALQLRAGVTYSFLLPAQGAALVFEATVERSLEAGARLSFPDEVVQGGFRGALRLPSRNGDALALSFLDARGEPRRTVKRSLDVSESGLSFPVCGEQDLLFPGASIGDLRVELPGGTVTAEAIVRGISPRDGEGRRVCGVELLDFEGARDRERWRRHVFTKAWPRTLDRDHELAQLAWQVLDRSEYLELWTEPLERQRLGREFLSQWREPARLPGHLIVLRDDERNVGTFATSRCYPHTWLLHSLGVDRAERRKRRYFLDAARELYGAMLTLLKSEPDGRYFVLFVQKDKRWTELLYGCFVEALPGDAVSLYDEYSLFKIRSRAESPQTGDVAPRVEAARGPALAWLAERLAERLSPLEREAYDYTKAGFATGEAQGSARFRRIVFVASDVNGPRSALIAESGSDGVNVFGLLNNCRLFHFAPFASAAEESAVSQALLRAAAESYASLGVDEFIVFATSEAVADAARAEGGRLVSAGVRWLASCALLPAWLNYVDEVLQVKNLDARGGA